MYTCKCICRYILINYQYYVLCYYGSTQAEEELATLSFSKHVKLVRRVSA